MKTPATWEIQRDAEEAARIASQAALDPRYAGFSRAEQRLVERYRGASARQRRVISLLLAEFTTKTGRP